MHIRFFLISLLFLTTTFGAYKGKVTAVHTSGFAPTIVLDAGHGGANWGGHIKEPYTVEKRLTLSTTMMVKKYLEQLGYRVVLTRATDVFIPLPTRVSVANNSMAEIFVSIHFNWCSNKTIHGIEVFYCDASSEKKMKSSKKLAKTVLTSMVCQTRAKSRGVKKANYLVIRDVKMPAILVEGGFMSNNLELNHLHQYPYLEKVAKGIASGIDKFIYSSK